MIKVSNPQRQPLSKREDEMEVFAIKKDIKPDIESELEQTDRKYGHVVNFDFD